MSLLSALGRVLTSLILLWCRDRDWGYQVVVQSLWIPMIFLSLPQACDRDSDGRSTVGSEWCLNP